MKKILTTLYVGVCLLAPSIELSGYILKDAARDVDIKESLVMDWKWVPYPDYKDRQGWDQLLGGYKDKLISVGNNYAGFEWNISKATDYLEYKRTGNRNRQEEKIRKNAEALSRLMVAELAEGKGRYIDDIIDGTFLFCEMTSWAVSAHIGFMQESGMALPDYKESVLALFQGNFSQMLAWIWYFFQDEFDSRAPGLSSRLEYEIRRRELEPYLERDDFNWMGFLPESRPNNWNPWCNSNAIVCFMLLENNRDVLSRAVEKSIRSTDAFLEGLNSDGACEEGPVYWYVSAGHLLGYLECLERITGGKVSIWHEPLIKKHGEYIVNANINGKWQANFADASPDGTPGTPTIYRYGLATGSDLMKGFSIASFKALGYDPVDVDWVTFYRAIQNLVACNNLSKEKMMDFKPLGFVWYPVSEVCYMRSGKGFLATKGGNNHEHHNHNDVGSCIYFFNGNPVLIDAGAGTYNGMTFDKNYRYTIWNNSSDYHNVPRIGGFPQRYGYEFKASGVTVDEKRKTFSADIAKAYPDSAGVKSWRIDYRLLKDGALKITESFILKEAGIPVQFNFLVCQKPETLKSGIICIGTETLLHYDAKRLNSYFEPISLFGTGISELFGDTLYRISLSSASLPDKGTISFLLESSGKKIIESGAKKDIISFAAKQTDAMLAEIANYPSKGMNPVTVDENGNVVMRKYSDWRSGFFPGTLWYLYALTGDKKYMEAATERTEAIKYVQYITDNHDVGFMTMCSFGNGLKLSGKKEYESTLVQAARSLMTRFRPVPGVFQSWGASATRDWNNPVIIDNMMNLELLFEAFRITGDSTFIKAAISHADRTLKEHFRPDGSCFHVVDYDPSTGEVRKRNTAQGLSDSSIWSRGQAWAIYGYTMMFRYTGERKYLEQVQKTFRMMKNHPDMPADCIPWWDMCAFAQTGQSTPKDASAAAVIASALYELCILDSANYHEYKVFADKIISSLESAEYLANYGENGNFIIKHSSGNVPAHSEVDVPLNYADYYFLEALYRKSQLEKN